MGRILVWLSLLMITFACEKATIPPYWGYAIEGFPNQEAIEFLKKETPFFPDFISFYMQWPKEEEAFVSPLNTFEAIWEAGSVPCVTWEPMFYEKDKKIIIDLEQVLAGKYDAYIAQVAQSVLAFKKPLLIRFAHEMNLEEYHWGMEDHYNHEAPLTYQRLYKYVVDAFRNARVNNVLWVFCPNADSVPAAPWNHAAAYYPGDRYVDILGMDGYNWNGENSFKKVLTPLFQQLQKINDQKPIFVFETATDGTPQQKQAWIKEAIHTAENWGLQGIIWFQVNKEKSWKMPPSSSDLIRTPPPQSAQKWAESLLKNKF